jgi:hypothetical protein
LGSQRLAIRVVLRLRDYARPLPLPVRCQDGRREKISVD